MKSINEFKTELIKLFGEENEELIRAVANSTVEFAQRWIPVEEELPEVGMNILANDKDYGMKLYLDLDEIDKHEIEYTCNKWRPIERK